MSDNSRISWTSATWSPVTGCTRISDGCLNCYIERTPPFRMSGRKFASPCPQCRGDGLVLARSGDRTTVCDTCHGEGRVRTHEVGSSTGVRLHPDRLGQPLRWRKPRRVFVCSMADLFHDDVPEGFIARVFTAMAMAPQHTFQVLTKRPARMRSFLTRWYDNSGDADLAWRDGGLPPMPRGPQAVRDTYPSPRAQLFADMLDSMGTPPEGCAYPLYDWAEGQIWWPTWPLPNVWIGVSAETQQWADIRIPALLDTPAAVRWVSAEPLLGPLSLEQLGVCNAPWHYTEYGTVCSCGGAIVGPNDRCNRSLSWLVVGGESGPGARRMDPDWATSLQWQCQDAGVPFFFKQYGTVLARELGLTGAGSDPSEWPEAWPQEYPEAAE